MIFVNIKKIMLAQTREQKVKEAAIGMVKAKVDMIEKILIKAEEGALEVMFDLQTTNIELSKKVEELEEQLAALRAIVGRNAARAGEV